jgi:hypothetical protein
MTSGLRDFVQTRVWASPWKPYPKDLITAEHSPGIILAEEVLNQQLVPDCGNAVVLY